MFHLRIFFLAGILTTVGGSPLKAQIAPADTTSFRIMTFNILQGGEDAGNVGFDNAHFGESRIDEIAAVIRASRADVVGVQEDCQGDQLLSRLGADWNRQGSIYSRFNLTAVQTQPFLSAVKVAVSDKESVILVNCHWFPPRDGYGPDVIQSELRKSDSVDSGKLAQIAVSRCSVPDGPRGYNATLELLTESIMTDEAVILTGDFNEPSHLDWTAAYAKLGQDRWVKNPTRTPLRFAVEWPGSIALERLRMIDSFRSVHPDEVRNPGFTWTPPYPSGTPGRRPFEDQCLDRIDRIYHFGPSIKATSAEMVGEDSAVADIVPAVPWPSDHRAVVVEFEIEAP